MGRPDAKVHRQTCSRGLQVGLVSGTINEQAWCWGPWQVHLLLASASVLVLSFPHRRTQTKGGFFPRSSVLSCERGDIGNVKLFSYPFNYVFSHFCVPPVCYSLLLDSKSFIKVFLIHRLLLN